MSFNLNSLCVDLLGQLFFILVLQTFWEKIRAGGVKKMKK